ncbi:hypothetical protein [Marinifilum caeruleilacunae]|nr:hypothetical protein [Marinifilum caeruleilacunae]
MTIKKANSLNKLAFGYMNFFVYASQELPIQLGFTSGFFIKPKRTDRK